MRNLRPLLAILFFTGCSALPISGDGIVGLQLLVPTSLTIAPTDSVILRAKALDINGDSIAAAIRWFTTDTTVIQLDSITGTVHAILTTGSGRVQAGVGTLRSDIITITIRPPTP